jgi:hypothetical protein
MACSGTHCSNHGTGVTTTTCAGHRAACPTNNAAGLSGSFAVQGGLITAADINALKNAIRTELTRYSLHRSFPNSGAMSLAYASQSATVGNHVANSTVIDDAHIDDYEQMAQRVNNVVEPVGTSYAVLTDAADGTTSPLNYNAGDLIEDTHWATLLSKYNTMRQDCICNSDCACNNVCNCHNDCACNYSDERLKENIQYLYTKKGIKLYSFNYIWEKGVVKVGVMAQDLLNTIYSNAVVTDKDGYYKVNYNKLPI